MRISDYKTFVFQVNKVWQEQKIHYIIKIKKRSNNRGFTFECNNLVLTRWKKHKRISAYKTFVFQVNTV